MARISVVVPFYNNEDLLGDCLASIAAQTCTDLQVIMVDDGSTDGSAAIARSRAAADPRFTLVSVPNGGPGSARNHGVAAASGEFLAFVDADDMLPPDAYETLLPVLQQSGSDFVSGAVRRLSADGLRPSGLHSRAIKARRLGTQISRTPELFYDISVWNKLFRRSFWDAAGLAFPEGMLWEDLVAMTRAHVLASAVDVITEPVYCWRDRDKGAPSITQSRTDISNFRDRITALELIDDFLRERGTQVMLHQHQHKALVNDIWLYIGDLSRTSADYRAEFTALARRYLSQVSPKLMAKLPSGHKLAYYLIECDRQAELAQFATWLAAQPGRTPPMVRRFGRLSADLPLRRDRGLAIPARVFRPTWRELDPVVQVDGISWAADRLVVTGSAYIPSVDIGARRHTSKLVILVSRGHRRLPVLLRARSVRDPAATARSGQDRYSYDWAGFSCAISPRRFRLGRRWLTGDWDCFVLVRARGVWRPARLHTPAPGAEHSERRQIATGAADPGGGAGPAAQRGSGADGPAVQHGSSAAVQRGSGRDRAGVEQGRQADPARPILGGDGEL
jgi:CDP-glycerol glycerophosphotransferase